MNEETGEFKQVGKSCLKEFTGGMSAEGVAYYISLFDELIAGEAPSEGRGERYYSVKEYLAYVAETIKHFGYVRTQDSGRSTRDRAFDYYMIEHGGIFSPDEERRLKQEMKDVSFDSSANDSVELVKNAVTWVDSQNADTNYMHNLKTACSLEYTTYRNLGILSSLFHNLTNIQLISFIEYFIYIRWSKFHAFHKYIALQLPQEFFVFF